MKIIKVILLVILVWMAITNIIQAFKNPKMTNTELFLHIPKSIVLNYE
jgi:hypothetical protein